jgi:hypothetical protein
MRHTQPSMIRKRVYMSKFARGLRMAVLAGGVAVLAACQMSSEERTALDQARTDAAAAQAAADRASQAADRAAAAAQQAADSASSAQMAAERSDRAMAQGLRK